jgi:hypothetical protein
VALIKQSNNKEQFSVADGTSEQSTGGYTPGKICHDQIEERILPESYH